MTAKRVARVCQHQLSFLFFVAVIFSAYLRGQLVRLRHYI